MMHTSPPVLTGFTCATAFCLLITGCTEKQDPVATEEKVGGTNLNDNAQSAMAVRINAGALKPFTNSNGEVWQADKGFEDGDLTERDPGTVIKGTKSPSLFRSEHYGMSGFTCDVPNGKYSAKLYFAETFDAITGPGQRVFSFNVQGHIFKDFDVWARAGGPNRAYVETIPVEVTNGVFHIDFTNSVENPEINAIELIPQG